jgi:hypothetical protein
MMMLSAEIRWLDEESMGAGVFANWAVVMKWQCLAHIFLLELSRPGSPDNL